MSLTSTVKNGAKILAGNFGGKFWREILARKFSREKWDSSFPVNFRIVFLLVSEDFVSSNITLVQIFVEDTPSCLINRVLSLLSLSFSVT